MRTTMHRAAIVGVALTLVLAACGGGDNDAGDGDDGDGANTPAPTQQPADNDATIVPTSIPDIFGLSDECEGLANVMLGVVQAFAGAVEGTDQLFDAGVLGPSDGSKGREECPQSSIRR